jgi:hypothetical protein
MALVYWSARRWVWVALNYVHLTGGQRREEMTVGELVACLAAEDQDATVLFLAPYDDVSDAEEVMVVETSQARPGLVYLSTGETNLRFEA